MEFSQEDDEAGQHGPGKKGEEYDDRERRLEFPEEKSDGDRHGVLDREYRHQREDDDKSYDNDHFSASIITLAVAKKSDENGVRRDKKQP
jgi:hypothetical protein